VGQTIAFSDLAEVLHASKSAIQQVMAKLEGDDTEAAPAGDTASGGNTNYDLLILVKGGRAKLVTWHLMLYAYTSEAKDPVRRWHHQKSMKALLPVKMDTRIQGDYPVRLTHKIWAPLIHSATSYELPKPST
jgi:hypothetical protein